MIRFQHRVVLLAIGAIALAGVAAGLARPSVSSAAHSLPALPGNALLPDLGALPPRDIDIVQVRVKGGVEKRLRFDTLMANTGTGPLEIFPGAQGCYGPESLTAMQRVFIDSNGDGKFQRGTDTASSEHPVGCMVFHRKHHHWHVEGFAAYRLYVLDGAGNATGSPVAFSEKVSFCMLDMEQVPNVAVAVPFPYYAACGRNATMGISPGWADEYYSGLADQWIAISGTHAESTGGNYCLVNVGNIAAIEHRNKLPGLIESTATYPSNARGVRINISNSGTTVTPSGTACSPP